jgi:hypothetical protein
MECWSGRPEVAKRRLSPLCWRLDISPLWSEVA